MNALTLTNLPKVATPEAAAHIKSCLTPFKASRPKDRAELEQTISAIEYLTKPAPSNWTAARVVTLLSHYFTAQQEAAQVRAVAVDWADMLADYPAWAIANACRWWLGHENPRRSYKPVPGDIQYRAHREMEGVRAAKIMVGLGVAAEKVELPASDPSQARERASAAASIIAEVGLGMKNGR